MGSDNTKLETTIIEIESDETNLTIKLSPRPYGYQDVILCRKHPDYIQIYNMLEEGKTFWIDFVYRDPSCWEIDKVPCWEIDSLSKPSVYQLYSTAKGILRIDKDRTLRQFSNKYSEIVLNSHKTLRFLISHIDADNILMDQSYKFIYVKDFESIFYRILKFSKCDNDVLTTNKLIN